MFQARLIREYKLLIPFKIYLAQWVFLKRSQILFENKYLFLFVSSTYLPIHYNLCKEEKRTCLLFLQYIFAEMRNHFWVHIYYFAKKSCLIPSSLSPHRNWEDISGKNLVSNVKLIIQDGIGTCQAPKCFWTVRHCLSYLCGILGQWDILLLNLTSIGFTNFF